MNVPILSKNQEVFIVLAGRPEDETFLSDLKDLKGAMELARDRLTFPKGSEHHRRGQYPSFSTGISYGGGSKVGRPLKST